MLKLYDLPISSYGCKIRILLRHKKLDWNSVAPPDGYGSPAYCKIVPSGTIPALDHNGFIIAESDAIAEYLNELEPTPPMLPANIRDRAAARAMSRFHDTRIEPLLRGYFGQVNPANRNFDFITENAALLQNRLVQFDEMATPKPYLGGDDLGLVDCGFAASFAIIKCLQSLIGFDLVIPAALQGYSEALIAHPSVAQEHSAYVTALNDWAALKMAG